MTFAASEFRAGAKGICRFDAGRLDMIGLNPGWSPKRRDPDLYDFNPVLLPGRAAKGAAAPGIIRSRRKITST